MIEILRANDEDVLVYVAPTKALVCISFSHLLPLWVCIILGRWASHCNTVL